MGEKEVMMRRKEYLEDFYEENHTASSNYIEIEKVHHIEEDEVGPRIVKSEFISNLWPKTE